MRTAIKTWRAETPPSFTGENFANLLIKYLDVAAQRVVVHLGERSITLDAAKVAAHFGQFVSNDPQLMEQTDFKSSVALLFTKSDLMMVGRWIEKLHVRARELDIPWSQAEIILRQGIEKARSDTRSIKVQRGEILVGVIEELERIKERKKEFKSFEELSKIFPNFEVVQIMRQPKVPEDDRDYLANPSQWETRPESYARAILKKIWGEKSQETLKVFEGVQDLEETSWAIGQQEIYMSTLHFSA